MIFRYSKVLAGMLFCNSLLYAQAGDDDAAVMPKPIPKATVHSGLKKHDPSVPWASMPLKIVWKHKESVKVSEAIYKKEQKKIWLKACQSLGTALTVGNGPWGIGVFSGSSCWIDGAVIAGKAAPGEWTLEYREFEESTEMKLKDAEGADRSTVTFGASNYTAYFFADKEFVDLLALRLLDKLPALGFLVPGTISMDGRYTGRYFNVPPSGIARFPTVTPPKMLNLYQLGLHTTSKVYFADIGGSLRLEGIGSDSAVSGKQTAGASKVKLKTVRWRSDEDLGSVNAERGFWFHNADGAGKLSPSADLAIAEAQKNLSAAADQNVLNSYIAGTYKERLVGPTGGYVGIRYGLQVLKGDPLIEKTSFFGLVTEVRGGMLAGLRVYYDLLPKKSLDQDGHETSVEWNRVIVGKSFGMKMPWLVDRIEITPKLGVWNFHAKLPATYTDEGKVDTVGSFDLHRSLSLAIELGMEWSSSWYAVRPWYGFDGAAALSKTGGSKSVTSNRFGIDAFWKTGSPFRIGRKSFRTAILGFLMYESIVLRGTESADLEEGTSEIIGVTLKAEYVGGGVAISW